jgi:hypothetical protein
MVVEHCMQSTQAAQGDQRQGTAEASVLIDEKRSRTRPGGTARSSDAGRPATDDEDLGLGDDRNFSGGLMNCFTHQHSTCPAFDRSRRSRPPIV